MPAALLAMVCVVLWLLAAIAFFQGLGELAGAIAQ